MEERMIDTKTAPYGALLLRLGIGILFILHGVYLKAFVFGMTGTGKFFATLSLPEWFAWLGFTLTLFGDGAHALKSDARSKMIG